MPVVTVIMPCFNHGRFLKDSAQSILQQTYTDLELLIIDDCSRDDSWQLALSLAEQDPRIRVTRHECNQGASRSRNDGLATARGHLIGFCDADDIWERDKLRRQVEQLQEATGYAVAYCDASIVDEEGLPTGQLFSERFPAPKGTNGWVFPELIRRNFINMQTVLMRRDCVQRAGRFDEGIKWVEDWWYWVRVARQHRFLYSEEPLARYRVHRASTNLVQKRGCCINRFKVFRRILRQYADLPWAAKAEIVYNMGAELCELGKSRWGRRLFWEAAAMARSDARALSTGMRALGRLTLDSAAPGLRAWLRR